jgi:hypothetical protein
MDTKTFKCVQCGECMVQSGGVQGKDGKPSRTGCVLFHDKRPKKKTEAPEKGIFRRLQKLFGGR